MKKLLSVLLVCSMILLTPLSVFAIDTEAEVEKYDLEELFANYKDFSTDEMIEFINANPQVAYLLNSIRSTRTYEDTSGNFMLFVHLEREGGLVGAEKMPDVKKLGVIEENSAKYLLSTARVTKPTEDEITRNQLGELGNRLMTVELIGGFVDYACSLEHIEGNVFILNFIMNILNAEDVVGFSWYADGDIYLDDLTVSVLPVDADKESEKYGLEDLFVNYKDFSTGEKLEFLASNPQVANLFYWLRATRNSGGISGNFMFFVHLEREGSLTGSEKVPDVSKLGIIAENSTDYLLSTARVINPTDDGMPGNRIGELGNRLMTVELIEGFADYACSLDRVEGNNLILNFLMNIVAAEDVVGISWYSNYDVYYDDPNNEIIPGDCNGDGAVNGIDGNLTRRILSGKDCTVDPFTVDANGDGKLNAMDSLFIKLKIAG